MNSCQKINSTQKLKLLGEDQRYDLYYFLTILNPYLTWSIPKTRSSPLFLASFCRAERPCSRSQGCLMERACCLMERDEADDMLRRYTVRAQLKVMILMGQDIWVDVEHLPLYGLWRVWHISCWPKKRLFHSTGSLL